MSAAWQSTPPLALTKIPFLLGLAKRPLQRRQLDIARLSLIKKGIAAEQPQFVPPAPKLARAGPQNLTGGLVRHPSFSRAKDRPLLDFGTISFAPLRLRGGGTVP